MNAPKNAATGSHELLNSMEEALFVQEYWEFLHTIASFEGLYDTIQDRKLQLLLKLEKVNLAARLALIQLDEDEIAGIATLPVSMRADEMIAALKAAQARDASRFEDVEALSTYY